MPAKRTPPARRRHAATCPLAPASSRPATTSVLPFVPAAPHAASTRSRPFFAGFAPYVTAATSRSTGRPARLDRHRHDDRVGVRRRRLGQPALAPRHEQGRVAASAAARPAAARPRGGPGGCRPPGRRSGSRPAAAPAGRPSSTSRAPRAAGARGSPPPPPRRAARAQASSSSAYVRHSRGRSAARHDHLRPRAPQRRRPAPRPPAAAPRSRPATPAGRRRAPHGWRQERAAEARRAHELHRPQRRRLLDVEAHGVALLDRGHRRLLAPPRQRPDDREARRHRRHLGQEEAEHARRANVEISSGHSRFAIVIPGRSSGSVVCVFAVASSRAIGGVASARRPSRRPDHRRHQPPAGGHVDRRRLEVARQRDHRQRGEQRRRTGAEQDRRLEEVDEAHRARR